MKGEALVMEPVRGGRVGVARIRSPESRVCPGPGVLACLGALDQPREALEQADKALALDPGSAFAWTVRGGALMQLQRFDDALIAYDRAIGLSNNSTYALTGKAEALYRLARRTPYTPSIACSRSIPRMPSPC